MSSLASGWITAVKQAAILIGQLDKHALKTLPQTEVVQLGHQFWQITNQLEEFLTVVKDRLRTDAGAATETVKFGPASVIPHSPTIEVKKDFDAEALQQKLGESFGDYFEEVTTYKPRKDFQEKVKKADPRLQALLLEAVNLNARIARVVFKD